MSTAEKICYSPAEYLKRERNAEYKSEYFNGEIVAMAGASRAHVLLVSHLVRFLGNQLDGSGCDVYSSDLRVKVDATGLYTYPDVVVACGEPRFEDDHVDTLLNPTMIIEVLSDSTEAYDRGKKFAHYRSIPSLQEYVLVAQNEVSVEWFTRQADGQWILSEQNDVAGTIQLRSVECNVSMADLYNRVTFEEQQKA